MKKKIFALGLAACMAASLAACGGSKTAETTAGADTAAAGTEASAAEASQSPVARHSSEGSCADAAAVASFGGYG